MYTLQVYDISAQCHKEVTQIGPFELTSTANNWQKAPMIKGQNTMDIAKEILLGDLTGEGVMPIVYDWLIFTATEPGKN